MHTTAFHAGGGRQRRHASRCPTACTAFHDYQLHLDGRRDRQFSVDGQLVHRYRQPAHRACTAWPFDAPQYLLLNIAIGGVLGGAVDDRIFPVTMEVEHVRVYQAPR